MKGLGSGLIVLTLDSPIGRLAIEGDERTVMRILLPELDGSSPLDGNVKPKSAPAPIADVHDLLKRYFAGEHVAWGRRPIPAASPFVHEVWKITAKIPFGKVMSYRDLAVAVGNPRASRGAGYAMAHNPLPILIPCHRVLSSSGGLGGYGGGMEMKRWLLRHEGAAFA